MLTDQTAAWADRVCSVAPQLPPEHAVTKPSAISRRAALTSGYVLLAVVLGAFVWEIAHGRDGQPYAQLGAVAGLSFLVGTLWYRRTM